MPGSVSYVLPTDRMTLTDEKEHRHKAILAGLKVAVNHGWANQTDYDLYAGRLPLPGPGGAPGSGPGVVQSPATVDIRELQPTLDLGAVLDSWTTAPLLLVNGFYALPAGVAAFGVPGNRVYVFYKVGTEAAFPIPVSRIRFQVGQGNFRGVFDLEPLFTHDIIEGYFSEPMIYATPELITISVRARIAPRLGVIVYLGAVVIEVGGGVVA